MAAREDLKNWICGALAALGGEAKLVDVARHIWAENEGELRSSGDLFYTWQYEMRWAATRLREEGRLVAADKKDRVWRLT